MPEGTPSTSAPSSSMSSGGNANIAPLFREAALSSRQSEWLGSIRISSRPTNWVYAIVAGFLAMAILSVLTLGHYTQRETVTGRLVPDRGLLLVAAATSGTVVRTFVHDGQPVSQGQPLALISADQDSPQVGEVGTAIANTLRTEVALLQRDIANEKQLTEHQRSDLSDKISSLKFKLAAIDAQIRIQEKDVSAVSSVLSIFQYIQNRPYVSKIQAEEQKATLFQAELTLESLKAQRAQTIEDEADASGQLAELPFASVQKTDGLQRQVADLQTQLAENAAKQSVVLKAPQDGVVSSIIIDPGQAVKGGQSILSIMPAGARLYAQLLVPSRAIGFVHIGSRLNLRYAAFPYQEFGQYHGTVTAISGSALTPSEIAGLTEQDAKTPLYRVTTRLDRQTVDVYGEPTRLRAGLELKASIMLDKRRLIQWIFEPLYGIGRGLFFDDPKENSSVAR